ncbi:hypothetical protein TNCV_481581 [Trichonephila clavipes]|nr:hypothetical protein TNCV_481581 [Trichonephila clavipes]
MVNFRPWIPPLKKFLCALLEKIMEVITVNHYFFHRMVWMQRRLKNKCVFLHACRNSLNWRVEPIKSTYQTHILLHGFVTYSYQLEAPCL